MIHLCFKSEPLFSEAVKPIPQTSNVLETSLTVMQSSHYAQGLFLCIYMTQEPWTWCRLSMCPFCHSFFPIGDNITMLTTADWLLGSNSQSAAGLSTFSDTMKGQYLVFSPTPLRARMKGVFVVHFLEPPTSLMKIMKFVFKNQKYISWRFLNSPQLLCLSFRNPFSIFCNCCGILFQAWFDTTGF